MKSEFSRLYRGIVLCLVLLMLSSLLAACSAETKTEIKEKKVLRIAMLNEGTEEWFRKKYVSVYEAAHPNVTVKISYAIKVDMESLNKGTFKVPDPVESMKKVMNGENAVDVVVLDSFNMKRLIDHDMVKPLNPLIEQDKFDTSDIVPGVMEVIKQMSSYGNNIHALVPVFQPSALFYNKGIFQEAGVDLPKDGMTYDEIFSLARRVSRGEGKKRISGINLSRYPGSSYDNMRPYLNSLRLNEYDSRGEKMMVNTPQWEKTWETLSKLYKEKVLYNSPLNSRNGSEVNYRELGFMTGKVAMEIADVSLIQDLVIKNEAAKKDKNLTPIEWEVVTPPILSNQPEIGGNMIVQEAMAINNNAPDAELAWDFIKSVNSPEWAKIKGKSLGYEMVSHKSSISPMEGQKYNVEAFYILNPQPIKVISEEILSKKPGLTYSINNLALPIFQSVLDGEKTVKDGLAEWEKKGNDVLDYLKKDPKASFMPDGTPVPSEAVEAESKS